MALIHVNFYAETLGMSRSMDVIIPQIKNGIGQDGKFTLTDKDIPVLYLLHGGSDDHTMWQRRTSIERYAVSKGLAVIMPSTDMGCYTDMKYGYDFYTFYGKELPELVKEFFPCLSDRREKTFIAGQSMGGYGAFKLGLTYPERFSYVAALSAMIRPQHLFEGETIPEFAETIFGSPEEIEGSVNDLYADTENLLMNTSEFPNFMMICGTEDFLYLDNLDYFNKYQKALNMQGIWAPGEHEWGFWDRNIQKVLEWLPLDTNGEGK